MTKLWSTDYKISKKTYGVMTAFFLLYIISIIFEYNKEKKLISENEAYEIVSELKYDAQFNSQAYLFDNSAWQVISQKKEKSIDNNNTETVKIVPITIDKSIFPMRVCEKDDCYEFIAFKNDLMVFYGKKSDGTDGFINTRVGDSLNTRIMIKSRSSKGVEFFDNELNVTIAINLFDINISMYEIKEKMEIKNEK